MASQLLGVSGVGTGHLSSLLAEQERLRAENERLHRKVMHAKRSAERRLFRTCAENEVLHSVNSDLRTQIEVAKARVQRKVSKAQAENFELEQSNDSLREQLEAARRRRARKGSHGETTVVSFDHNIGKDFFDTHFRANSEKWLSPVDATTRAMCIDLASETTIVGP